MDGTTIIALVVGAGLSLSTAFILYKIGRMDKKSDERHKQNIEREVLLCTHRNDQSVLLLEVADAVQKKKCNGELRNAVDQFVKTNREYEKFVIGQAGVQLARK